MVTEKAYHDNLPRFLLDRIHESYIYKLFNKRFNLMWGGGSARRESIILTHSPIADQNLDLGHVEEVGFEKVVEKMKGESNAVKEGKVEESY